MGRIVWEPGAHALTLRNVSKQFGETRVLKDVSFDIPAGKVVALLGENGSGKSTIIKVISGFYDATPGGHVSVGGHELPFPIAPDDGHEVGLSFVHQDLGLVEAMTVFDNVCFSVGYGRLRGGAIREKDMRVRPFGIRIALAATALRRSRRCSTAPPRFSRSRSIRRRRTCAAEPASGRMRVTLVFSPAQKRPDLRPNSL